jgi:hypothetical protein
MRTVAPAVAGLILSLCPVAFAQPELPTLAPPPSITIPALPPSAEPPATLPGGAEVSQPLQPVVPTTPAPDLTPPQGFTEITLAKPAKCKPGEVLGRVWGTDDILMWYIKATPVPPLLTATRSGQPPVYGRPNVLTLVGNQAIDNQMIMGYRTSIGVALNEADTVGIEASYFFLGTRSASYTMSEFAAPRYQAMGLPYINALTGQEDVLTVMRPGVVSDLVTVSTTLRSQGVEVNGVANLLANDKVKLHAIGGYRFLQLQEGLRIEQEWYQNSTAATNWHNTIGAIADQFSTSNRFNGGQLGFMLDAHHSVLYCELTGKVALGANTEVLRTEGETHLITYGTNPLPLVRSYAGGVYTQPTNMGRITNSAFAVVPEGTIKFGLKGERSRFFVGYNFLYLSDAIRPGDQVDRTLNPSQIPINNPSGIVAGPDRPQLMIERREFWVQGLMVGFEQRY